MTRFPGDPGNLVLSRLPGTSVLIGDDIEVEVVGFRSEQGMVVVPATSVVLSVRAPRNIRVLRKELKDRPHTGGDK